MHTNRQRWSWVVDALLFGGFIIAMWLDLTGLAVHQWLGVAVAGLAAYHLVSHRQWVVAVTGRIMGGRTSRTALRNWAVDAGLALGFGAITATGVVMSTWLGLELAGYAAWRTAHVIISVATLALVVAKIALHWRWIVSVAQRHVFPAKQQGVAGSGAVLQPTVVVAGSGVGRRQFLSMMGAVGAVSLLAGAHALADDGAGAVASQTAAGAGSPVASNTSNSARIRARWLAAGVFVSRPLPPLYRRQQQRAM